MLISDKFQFKRYANLPLNNSMNFKNSSIPNHNNSTTRSITTKPSAEFKFQKAGAEQLIRSPRELSPYKQDALGVLKNSDYLKNCSPPRHGNLKIPGFGHQKFSGFGGARFVEHQNGFVEPTQNNQISSSLTKFAYTSKLNESVDNIK